MTLSHDKAYSTAALQHNKFFAEDIFFATLTRPNKIVIFAVNF
jgi:hypothetical protein